MSDVIDLSNKRKPTVYTIVITHYWDDTLEMMVYDVSEDARSRYVVGQDMVRLGGSAMQKAQEDGYNPEGEIDVSKSD
jgi:hypothetical protein